MRCRPTGMPPSRRCRIGGGRGGAVAHCGGAATAAATAAAAAAGRYGIGRCAIRCSSMDAPPCEIIVAFIGEPPQQTSILPFSDRHTVSAALLGARGPQ